MLLYDYYHFVVLDHNEILNHLLTFLWNMINFSLCKYEGQNYKQNKEINYALIVVFSPSIIKSFQILAYGFIFLRVADSNCSRTGAAEATTMAPKLPAAAAV